MDGESPLHKGELFVVAKSIGSIARRLGLTLCFTMIGFETSVGGPAFMSGFQWKQLESMQRAGQICPQLQLVVTIAIGP